MCINWNELQHQACATSELQCGCPSYRKKQTNKQRDNNRSIVHAPPPPPPPPPPCTEAQLISLLEMSCKILQGVPKACKILQRVPKACKILQALARCSKSLQDLTSSCKLLEHLARSYKTFLVGNCLFGRPQRAAVVGSPSTLALPTPWLFDALNLLRKPKISGLLRPWSQLLMG